MADVVIEHTIAGAGAWETVQGIPDRVRSWSMQARTNVAFDYRILQPGPVPQATHWTVKAGQVRSGATPFPRGRIQVRCGTLGTVIEIQCATAVRA